MPPYATLSHCWGNNDLLSLRINNYTSFRRRLPLLKLTQKFGEAMQCTKALSFHFIWIDSLCIIQDSEKDWALEASRMHNIYLHSSCNIAAASTPNGEGPLFAIPDFANSKPVKVHVRQAASNYFCDFEELWHDNITRSPLLRRGWVLQEVTLSPRTLYFCKNQMFWECLSLQACETWPDTMPQTITASDTKLALVSESERQMDPLDTRLNLRIRGTVAYPAMGEQTIRPMLDSVSAVRSKLHMKTWNLEC